MTKVTINRSWRNVSEEPADVVDIVLENEHEVAGVGGCLYLSSSLVPFSTNESTGRCAKEFSTPAPGSNIRRT